MDTAASPGDALHGLGRACICRFLGTRCPWDALDQSGMVPSAISTLDTTGAASAPPLSVLTVDCVARLWGAINRARRAGLTVAFLALFLTGSVAMQQGVQFMRTGQIASEFMGEMIRNMPERVVVADAWFLPQMAPYTFADKIWLLSEDEGGMYRLLQRLRKQTDEPLDEPPVIGPDDPTIIRENMTLVVEINTIIPSAAPAIFRLRRRNGAPPKTSAARVKMLTRVMTEAIIGLQVLPDTLGTQSFGQGSLNFMTVRFYGRAGGHFGRFCHLPGGHFGRI
jgi:hypothetical protein